METSCGGPAGEHGHLLRRGEKEVSRLSVYVKRPLFWICKAHCKTAQYIPPNPGKIVHAETQEVVGTHEGLWNFTIGQGARLRGHAQRLFVSAKDVHENIIYVVPGRWHPTSPTYCILLISPPCSDHPDLYKSKLTARGWQWIWANSPPLDLGTPLGARVSVQFAHRMPDVRGYIRRC